MPKQTIFTGGRLMEECSKSTRPMDMKVDFTWELLKTTIFMDLMLIFMRTTTLDGKDDGKFQILQLGFGKSVGVDGNMTSFGAK